MKTLVHRIFLAFSLAAIALLAGCGKPYATVKNNAGHPVMLLGYDPVAYFTQGKPVKGSAEHQVKLPERTYYFASADHKKLFESNAAKYEPQYGGFCASGAAYAIKLGSDPTAWQIMDGRLIIFGDVLGHEAWKLDPAWNVGHGDRLWPEIKDKGWRGASLSAYASKVPHYKTGLQIKQEWEKKNPGKSWSSYDPGGMVSNLFLKPPGWRAAEGFGQPALGYPQ
ncbi:MAG: YHS domain-containing (seleno)protein [Brachymonas sp.]